MASVLAQSIGMSGLLSGQRHGQHKGSGKSKRSLIMMSNLQMPALRMSSFSGLCTMNSLNLLSRSRRSFPFKMLTSISSRRERVPKAMFDRFTEKSTMVIMIAQAEARWMGQNFVGTGHILLGLIREGTGIAAKVMNSMGINLKDARVEVKKIIGRRSGSAALEIPFAEGVLELSLEEARQLGHNYIETEHLLLGILREGVGIAARVLENLGADPNKIRAQVIRMVGEGTGSNNNNKLPKYRRMTSMSSRPERVPTAMFARFTEKPTIVIILAQEEAKRLGHNFVGSEHILLGLIREGTDIAAKVMNSMGINLKDARVEVEKIIGRGSGFVALEIPFVQGVYELSLEEARQLGLNYIESEHLLLGILREGEGVAARVLENLGADPNNIRAQVIRMVFEGKMPTLEEYGTNLTKLAEEGKLDLVVGRKPQIERVTQILTRRYSKISPCLIGEPGVGKTIAEGLAQRIANGDVPETIKGKKVISLDVGLLVAGTKYSGEFEERLKKLMEEIKRSNEIILFIDEVHTLIGAGAAEGAIDAANILKHALARGGLQCIGATTLDEYRKHIEKDPALQRRFRLVEVPASTVDKTIQIFQYTDNALVAAALLSHQYIRKHIEKDPALERRFQPVKVPEPTVDETIQILKGLRESYEIHHKVQYTDDALVAAAQLSHQYIGDPFLPDKAIDLIDEAGSRVRLQHAQLSTPMVTEVDILHIVSSWTGIPVEKVSTDESDGLLKMEETLHTRVIGEDEAVKAISRAIRSARVGLKNPNRPIASFIFYGSTGVGKAELTKALAAYYFGSEEVMIRVDMSKFMERHTVFKLIGSPPGYVGYTEGGLLTEAVRRCPYSVVLFEEFEKAHPDVLNMILQILEDGRLTDSRGRTVDFKNTLLIIT